MRKKWVDKWSEHNPFSLWINRELNSLLSCILPVYAAWEWYHLGQYIKSMCNRTNDRPLRWAPRQCAKSTRWWRWGADPLSSNRLFYRDSTLSVLFFRGGTFFPSFLRPKNKQRRVAHQHKALFSFQKICFKIRRKNIFILSASTMTIYGSLAF